MLPARQEKIGRVSPETAGSGRSKISWNVIFPRCWFPLSLLVGGSRPFLGTVIGPKNCRRKIHIQNWWTKVRLLCPKCFFAVEAVVDNSSKNVRRCNMGRWKPYSFPDGSKPPDHQLICFLVGWVNSKDWTSVPELNGVWVVKFPKRPDQSLSAGLGAEKL